VILTLNTNQNSACPTDDDAVKWLAQRWTRIVISPATSMYTYIYIYIYIHRERERERETYGRYSLPYLTYRLTTHAVRQELVPAARSHLNRTTDTDGCWEIWHTCRWSSLPSILIPDNRVVPAADTARVTYSTTPHRSSSPSGIVESCFPPTRTAPPCLRLPPLPGAWDAATHHIADPCL